MYDALIAQLAPLFMAQGQQSFAQPASRPQQSPDPGQAPSLGTFNPNIPPLSPEMQRQMQVGQAIQQSAGPGAIQNPSLAQPDKPGAIKQYFANILHAIGEGSKTQIGMPTEFQEQQARAATAIAQQNADTNRDYKDLQGRAIEGGLPSPVNAQEAAIYGVPENTMMTPKGRMDAIKQRITNQGKTDQQSLKNEGGLDIQGLRNEGALDVASKRADEMRAALGARLASAERIANGHDATRLTAAQMMSNRVFQMAGAKAYDTGLQADTRYQQMIEQAKNPNPAGDKALLFNHIAMTIGAVKGGRVTEAEIQSHLKARSLPDTIMQAWDQVESGKSLTAEQRQNFLKLGAEVRSSIWDQAYRKADLYGVTAAPEDNPILPSAGTHVPKPGAGASKAGAATHVFVPGQGIVAIGGGRQ